MAATAGSMVFQKGGNAVDAACAMLAATCTMWDVLSWGGETQALIYNPNTKKVIAISAMGFAPTGATPEFFKSKGYQFPPEYGPLAATTPGTPGGICYMLSNYGTMSLKDVLAPANKQLNEVRGIAISDYQTYLEEQWVKELRAKYPVNINQAEIDKLIK